MSAAAALELALYLAAGALLGGLYFALLLQSVRLHVAQAAAVRIAPLYLLRLALAVSGFWLIAERGALPLLFALAGFVLARLAVQHWTGAE